MCCGRTSIIRFLCARRRALLFSDRSSELSSELYNIIGLGSDVVLFGRRNGFGTDVTDEGIDEDDNMNRLPDDCDVGLLCGRAVLNGLRLNFWRNC